MLKTCKPYIWFRQCKDNILIAEIEELYGLEMVYVQFQFYADNMS